MIPSLDRHLRAATDAERSRTALLVILAAAAALRFWRLGAGVPFGVGVDEPEIMLRVVLMMKTGDFNPHFFDYPTLYIYTQLMVAVVRFIVGAAAGQWASLADVTAGEFYMWGRAITAMAGTATVWLVYRAGRRWGMATALLAAAAMAVMPMHVRESHYVLTDVPQTLLVTGALVLSLRAAERGAAATFAAAGALAGLAAATKYTGGLALLLPLLACWSSGRLSRSRASVTAMVCGAFAAAFLMAAPYTVLDLPGFLNGFGHLASAYTGALPAQAPAVTYLKHLRNGLGWGGSLLVIAGLVLAIASLVTGSNRARWALVVAFPVIYFAFIARQSLVYGRYLLPILPFLAILAGVGVTGIIAAVRSFDVPRTARAGIAAAAALLLLGWPASVAVQFDRELSRRWTTELAYHWILGNVPAGTKLVIETTFLTLPREYHVDYTKRGMAAASDDYAARGVKYVVLSSEMAAPDRAREVARFAPSRQHPGPNVRILELTP